MNAFPTGTVSCVFKLYPLGQQAFANSIGGGKIPAAPGFLSFLDAPGDLRVQDHRPVAKDPQQLTCLLDEL